MTTAIRRPGRPIRVNPKIPRSASPVFYQRIRHGNTKGIAEMYATLSASDYAS